MRLQLVAASADPVNPNIKAGDILDEVETEDIEETYQFWYRFNRGKFRIYKEHDPEIRIVLRSMHDLKQDVDILEEASRGVRNG